MYKNYIIGGYIYEKKYSGLLLILGLIVSTFMSSAKTTYAHVGGILNNTKDSAVVLSYNTVDNSINGNPQILWNCKVGGRDDEDWYKVYLPSGIQTLSINAIKAVSVVVYDENDNPVFISTYGPATKIGQKFNISQAGTYYIQITSVDDVDASYYIMIGAPWYKSGTYTYNYSSSVAINVSTKVSSTVSFDLSSISSIPDTAVVTGVSIGGTETGSASGRVRSLKPTNKSTWIDLKEFTFTNNSVYSSISPIKVKQSWQFKHSVSSISGSSYSLKPSIIIRYMAEDTI